MKKYTKEYYIKEKIEAIKKKIKQEYPDLNKNKPIDSYEDIDIFTDILENDGIIHYNIRERTNQNEGWLQTEYYSYKIGKTIIFEYNERSYFKNLNSFAEYLANLQEDINDFDEKLTLNK